MNIKDYGEVTGLEKFLSKRFWITLIVFFLIIDVCLAIIYGVSILSVDKEWIDKNITIQKVVVYLIIAFL